MTHPPTGTLTFLFTDIEGSTARWEAQREAMAAALLRHDVLLREAIEGRGGTVFKTVGDAFCAVFADAEAALGAAMDAQRALAAEAWSAFGPEFADLRVRMGLHTGKADERGGDYFGPALNRTARLMSAGHGGQVLLSRATEELAADQLPPGCRLRDLGEHRLKDLRHSERIYQLVVEGLLDVVKAPQTAEALDARDRIIVSDPNTAEGAEDEGEQAVVVQRDVPETLAAILAVIRGDERSLVLTVPQVIAAARHRPADLTEYRLGRIAEWSQPRYRLDGRFVGLTLLIDQGEEAVQGRWAAKDERYEDLGELLAATSDPAVVVLGPPGGGKSTLLRRLELDAAIAGLRGEPANATEAAERITFFIPLSTYTPARPGDPPPAPGEWLSAAWQSRYPDLPALDDLLAEGRVTLLLDALNEIPAPSEKEFRARLQLWKAWLQQLAATRPGNRVVISCRSLDYSQPLSTPDLRVPQVRIEALSDEQVKNFLALYSPGRGREIWAALEGRPQLEVLRSPYFLALLVEQVEGSGEIPDGRAGLFTGFVRQALRREVERGSALFEDGELLENRDLRKLAKWQWQGPYDLPDRGPLIPKLSRLAHAMQEAREDGGGSQVRVDYDDALELLDSDLDEAIVKAGAALAVLDEDEAAGELMYIHQLVQEYFAARELAEKPNPELVRVEWRAAAVRPSVAEVHAGLGGGDTLPPLPQTGWEETTLLAAAMAADGEAFLRGVMGTNLVVAGRAAVQAELRGRLPESFLDELRAALLARCRDPQADLRERLAAGFALGHLGDPRFERRMGPEGAYLLPPLVAIPGGAYPIGDDDPIAYIGGISEAHIPRHAVTIAPFRIGQYPVTNGEYACFLAAGGYEDDRWWDTAAGRDWRLGIGTVADIHAGVRGWVAKCRANPVLMDELREIGQWDDEQYERGQRRLRMTEAELDAHLRELYPEQRYTEPRHWRDERFNNPSQPVVGVCWYEARAYCAWLSAQLGAALRLPTEAEWEAAARGTAARRYAWGDEFDPLLVNTLETRLKRTSPVGVFVTGDTPEGVSDLTGNVFAWTSSVFGKDEDVPEFGYPYAPNDGRENADASASAARVVRGGSWDDDHLYARASFRDRDLPFYRYYLQGFRLVISSPNSPVPLAAGAA